MNILKQILFGLLLVPFSLMCAEQQPEPLHEKIDSYIQAHVEKGIFNGAILVARGDEIILSKGYGLANFETKSPCTPQTQFQIASCTKSFTSLAIMLLQQQGKLNTQDSLDKYLPDFVRGNEITIHHLLTHSSGIIDYGNIYEYKKIINKQFNTYHNKALQYLSIDELIKMFKNKPLQFKPGEKFSYSNSGYVLLAAIIEKVSGKNYFDFVQENILTPFGMSTSGNNYYSVFNPDQTISYYLHPTIPANFDLSGIGDGCIYSTIEDLYRYDRAMNNVSPEILEYMFTPYFPDDDNHPNSHVGCGWFIDECCGHKRISHSGGINGYCSWITRFIEDDICIIILSNTAICPIEQLNNGLAELVFDGKTNRPKTGALRSALKTAAKCRPTRWALHKIIDKYIGV